MTFTVGPEIVPAGSTDEIHTDCWVRCFQLVNTGPDKITVSIYDRQNPPIALCPPTALEPNGGMVSGNFPEGRLMPNGLTWTADAYGAHGYILATESI